MKRLRYAKALAFLLVASATSLSQPPGVPEKFAPGVPVYRLPPDELVPVGKMTVMAAGPDWGVVRLNVVEAHKVTKGKGVKVCVLDTGLDYTHPDFGEVPQTRLKSFVPGQSINDVQGHGTHVMGRVAARGLSYGVAPEAEIWAAKVLDNGGSGAVTWIAAGSDWATTSGVDVISLSLGGNAADSYIPPAFARAEAAGVLIICAAGNDGPRDGTVDYPGNYKQSFTVGAFDSNNLIASFSSRGPNVFMASPGVQITSQYPGNRYAPMSGTSMATPHEAGLAALWVAANPGIPKKDRPAKYREARAKAAIDMGPAGRDSAYGWGRVDAAKLVANGVGGPTIPPVDPPPVVPPVPPVPPVPGKAFTGTLSYKDGVLVSVGPAPVTKIDREKVEAAVKGVMDGAIKDAAAGAAIDWSKLIQAVIEAIMKALAQQQSAAPPAGRWEPTYPVKYPLPTSGYPYAGLFPQDPARFDIGYGVQLKSGDLDFLSKPPYTPKP